MDLLTPRALPHFEIGEVCWEDGESVVYAGRSVAAADAALLWVPKFADPDGTIIKRIARHAAGAARLPAGCTVAPVGLVQTPQLLGLLLSDAGRRPLLIRPDPRQGLPTEVLRFAVATLDTLAVLHSTGLLHRSLAPMNLWAGPNGGAVTLFDLSNAAWDALAPPLAVNHATYRLYAAPEILSGHAQPDACADLFAFGAILYEWLLGRPPFYHQNRSLPPASPAAWRPDLPPQLSTLVMQLLSPEPLMRPALPAVRAALLSLLEIRRVSAGVGVETAGGAAARTEPTEHYYGRATELERLCQSLGRAAAGRSELALLVGPPGIGKTALAQQVQRRVEAAGGIFVGGKFDQLSRNKPYAAFTAAAAQLVSRSLTEPEQYFAAWKQRIATAVGLNGQLLIDLVPAFSLVLGPQPPLQVIPPAETRNRFMLIAREVLRACANPQRPLCILLDDLQWADPASLELLASFLDDAEVEHVLFIGTCRDAADDGTDPMELMRGPLGQAESHTAVLRLEGLSAAQCYQLVCDRLERTGADVRDLATLLWRRSRGNPFVLEQVIEHFCETGTIYFDAGLGQWFWRTQELWDSETDEDVAELLREKLRALPGELRDCLVTAACLGSTFHADRLATALDSPPDAVAMQLTEAIALNLIRPTEPLTHRFVHDRIQQAVFSLVPPDALPNLRFTISHRLVASVGREEALAKPFDIVTNMNAGAPFIKDRLWAAELNLAAGKISRATLAHSDAGDYLRTGLGLLDESTWQTAYRLSFELHTEAFETEYMAQNFARADRLFEALIARARDAPDRAAVRHTKILLDISTERYADALRTGQHALKELGVKLPRRVRQHHVLLELMRAHLLMLRREPSALAGLADMQDPALVAAARILLSLSPGAYFINPKATMLMGLQIATISMRRGNSPSSAGGYVLYGLALGAALGRIPLGQAYGELAVALARRFNDITVLCRTLLIHAGFVALWSRPFQDCIALLREAHETAVYAGDFTYANYAALQILFQSFACGGALPGFMAECERFRSFIYRTQDPFAIDNYCIWRQSALALQARTRGPTKLDSDIFDEDDAEHHYRTGSNLTTLGYYLVRKLHLCILFGEVPAAFRYGQEAERFFALLPGQVLLAEHALYFGLTLVAQQRQKYRLSTARRLWLCRRRLRKWAKQAPANYGSMHILLEAEQKTLGFRRHRALGLFNQAIEAAREHCFHNIEALAAERAAEQCLRAGQDRGAMAYLGEAVAASRNWGATAKVEVLSQRLAQLTRHQPTPAAPQPVLQLAAVAELPREAARAPANEQMLDTILISMVQRTLAALGAVRAVAVLREGAGLAVRAIGEKGGVELVDTSVDETELVSPAIVNYVARSGEPVLQVNPIADTRFAGCRYIRLVRPGPVTCVPIITGQQTIGVLYVEDATGAAPKHAEIEAVLELCGQFGPWIERARMNLSLRQSRQMLYSAARTAESAARMNALLEKFVPSRVQKLLLENPEAPELQLKDRYISILFVDMTGYTALSEQFEKDTLRYLVEGYFSQYLVQIHRYGGDAIQTVGDSILVIFQDSAHHPLDAVNTALAVQAATFEQNRVRDPGMPAIQVHIGINSGVAAVGATRIEAGASSYWIYAASGPAVNLASRIADLAQAGEILIGSDMVQHIERAFKLEELGPQTVKNVSEPITVYRVVGPI